MKYIYMHRFLQVISRKVKDKTLTGYTTIISAMGRESKVDIFANCDLLTRCLIVQWFDYTVLFIDPAVNSKASKELVLQVCLQKISPGKLQAAAATVVFFRCFFSFI